MKGKSARAAYFAVGALNRQLLDCHGSFGWDVRRFVNRPERPTRRRETRRKREGAGTERGGIEKRKKKEGMSL